MNAFVRTPSPPARTIDHTFPPSAPSVIPSSFHDIPYLFLLLPVVVAHASSLNLPALVEYLGRACRSGWLSTGGWIRCCKITGSTRYPHCTQRKDSMWCSPVLCKS